MFAIFLLYVVCLICLPMAGLSSRFPLASLDRFMGSPYIVCSYFLLFLSCCKK